MDLVCLFSFPLAGSIDPASNHPCSQPTPLPDPIAHIPTTHSSGPPGSVHFMPFTPRAPNLSLSFFCYLSLCTLSRSAWYTLSHLPYLWCQFLSVCTLFVSPPPAPPFVLVLFFFLSCSFHSSLSLIYHCRLPFFYCTNPLSVFTFPPPFQIPNVLYSCSVQFIANTFLMVEV